MLIIRMSSLGQVINISPTSEYLPLLVQGTDRYYIKSTFLIPIPICIEYYYKDWQPENKTQSLLLLIKKHHFLLPCRWTHQENKKNQLHHIGHQFLLHSYFLEKPKDAKWGSPTWIKSVSNQAMMSTKKMSL